MRALAGLMVSAFALVLSTAPVWSWGLDGHRAIGMIADLLLANDPAIAAVSDLLGGVSLSEASVWADCAKGYCGTLSKDEQAYVHQNPQHRTFHYTDVPIQQSEYKLGTAGTRDNDIVQVTKQAVNVLRGAPPNNGPAVLDRKSALWVLAHMVGDLHQPLHVGAIYYADDCAEVVDPNITGVTQSNFGIGTTIVSSHGGNDLKLPNGKSFHVAYWDEGTVTGAMRLAGANKKAVTDFAIYAIAHPPDKWITAGDPETWPQQWATEIMPIANAALTKVHIGDGVHVGDGPGLKCTWPVTLDRDYTNWANQQALTELSRAGFRLAAILRAVFR
jgi:hypothetical protein